MPNRQTLLVLIAVVLIRFQSAHALEPCTGYLDSARGWSLTWLSPERLESHCPEGMAILAVRTITAGIASAEHAAPTGSCCPLPPNALRDQHSFTEVSCPPDMVVTGVRFHPEVPLPVPFRSEEAQYQIRCTKLNTEILEYKKAESVLLSAAQPFETRLWPLSVRALNRAALPAELRFGLGRTSKTHWEEEFCVGFPWGSPLRSIGFRHCTGTEFTAIRPRASVNNSMQKRASCSFISNLFSVDFGCAVVD